MDNITHITKVVNDFDDHIEKVDPYRDGFNDKFDRFVRAVITAYDHRVRRTECQCTKAHLQELANAYKAYKAGNQLSIINAYNIAKAYHMLTACDPCVPFHWAINLIYESDHK